MIGRIDGSGQELAIDELIAIQTILLLRAFGNAGRSGYGTPFDVAHMIAAGQRHFHRIAADFAIRTVAAHFMRMRFATTGTETGSILPVVTQSVCHVRRTAFGATRPSRAAGRVCIGAVITGSRRENLGFAAGCTGSIVLPFRTGMRGRTSGANAVSIAPVVTGRINGDGAGRAAVLAARSPRIGRRTVGR